MTPPEMVEAKTPTLRGRRRAFLSLGRRGERNVQDFRFGLEPKYLKNFCGVPGHIAARRR